MISIAIQGFGIVIWDGDGRWRTFAPSDAIATLLNARVELALATVPHAMPDDEAAMGALLDITGARLFAIECGHGPGECDDAVDLG